MLLREVLKVPEEELEAEMAPGGHPWHRFYTQVSFKYSHYYRFMPLSSTIPQTLTSVAAG